MKKRTIVNKRKGFTLIEVIASIAILSLLTVAISVLFQSSAKIWDSGKVKLQNVTHVNSVANLFKARGKRYIKGIYDSNDKDSYDKVNFYLFFDNYTECSDAIYNDNLVFPPVGTDLGIDNCKANNSGNKRYGALVRYSVAKKSVITNIEYYNEMYKVEIELWDLKENNSLSSTTAIQIER
ncbi:MAG: prepilin-type N-terminal cleavage/methylation domain-containing protein [Clostridiales bacterium]|nr:prepilin-type N-terminal cleavage/methylation domain-containing protein [Clostridiales bacterium]